MLDDDQGVAHVPQLGEGPDEPAVVPLVQADRGLIQDVEHAHEPGPDLGGQADALGLAAGQRRGGALQVEVVQAHVHEERQARLDLLEHLLADLRLAGAELQVPEERVGVPHGHAGGLGDVLPAHGQGEHGRVQPGAVAGRAGHLAHVLLVAVLGVVRLRLRVLALDVADHALEALGVAALPAEPVPVGHGDLVVLALEDRLARLGGQLPPRGDQVEAELLAQPGEQAVPVLARGLAERPRGDRALHEGEVRVGDHELLVDLEPRADAVALRARAERGVEGEGPGLDLVGLQGVLVGAGEVLGERAAQLQRVGDLLVRAGHELDDDAPLGEAQRRLDGVGQALADALLDHEPVHHHLDGVLVLLLELGRVRELDRLAVHGGAGEALRGELLEEVHELALALAHHGREHLEAGRLRHLEELVHDLLRGLLLDRLAALGAVRVADARPQQAHVVVDLGDRAHGGARVAGGGLLVDGHRRGQALDEVDVRLVHPAQEHPGVGGQGLDVAALTLGEDRVEGQ